MAEQEFQQPVSYVQKVSVKQDTGGLSNPTKIGLNFENVIDYNSDNPNNSKYTKYTLKQFFDHYMKYMQNADFIYYGEETPENHKVRLWLDTTKQ